MGGGERSYVVYKSLYKDALLRHVCDDRNDFVLVGAEQVIISMLWF